MPEFFLPGAEDDAAKAEKLLDQIAKSVGRPVPVRRVFRVSYLHNGVNMTAEVGKDPHAYYHETGPVIAIFDGDPLYVCLPGRGVLTGDPIFVGEQDVLTIDYFGE